MMYQLATGDRVHKYNRCLVVPFQGKRKVMSTSMNNGGYREDITAVFNHDVNPGVGMTCEYCKSGQEEKRKRFIIDDLGLDYDTVAYMATIVSMDSASIKSETYDELTVTVITTASLEVNGGRVGEVATCYEKHGESINLKPGTINIMVFTNADMTPGCMARAMVTATEGKTAALQELMARSLRSTGIATGSGTDNIMIIANSESDNTLTYAGKHGKLGELIGRLVMETVKESLEKHMGLTTESQHSMLARISRYGINEKNFCDKLDESLDGEKCSRAEFINNIHNISSNEKIVAMTSLYIHILDELNWGLISINEALFSSKVILKSISEEISVNFQWKESFVVNKEECIKLMLDYFVTTIYMSAVAEEK